MAASALHNYRVQRGGTFSQASTTAPDRSNGEILRLPLPGGGFSGELAFVELLLMQEKLSAGVSELVRAGLGEFVRAGLGELIRAGLGELVRAGLGELVRTGRGQRHRSPTCCAVDRAPGNGGWLRPNQGAREWKVSRRSCRLGVHRE
jgi:hypothetical protein